MSNRIVIDIGHGANTFPPSKGRYLPNGETFAEHDFNSKVAEVAIPLAEHNGFEVIVPQKPFAKEVALNTRIRKINNEHDKEEILCLVSIHANANQNPSSNGWGVFHWHTSTNGQRMARAFAEYATELLPINVWGSGVWRSEPDSWSNFAILRETKMPAILAEYFFFTNNLDLEIANTPEYINLSAEVLVKTVCEYAGKIFKPLGAPKPSPPKPKPSETFDVSKLVDMTIFVEGKPLVVSSVIQNSQTFVHIRPVLEYMGYKVDWVNGKVTANGKPIPDAPSLSGNGMTLVHIRPVLEGLGHEVDWKWNTVRVDEDKAVSTYYEEDGFNVIKTSPDNLDVVKMGRSLKNNNGINTNFLAGQHPIGVALGSRGLISWGVANRKPPAPPRATLFYDGEKVIFAMVDDIRKKRAYPKMRWATSGGSLLPINLDKEELSNKYTLRSNYTAIMVKGDDIYLVAKPQSTLEEFTTYAKSNEMDHAIFCESGSAAQLNYHGLGMRSSMSIPTAMILRR